MAENRLVQPEVATHQVLDLYTDHAVVSGEIIRLGDHALTDHGFVWGTHPGPTVADHRLSLGSIDHAGTLQGRLEALEENTSYFVRCFVEYEGAHIVYGNELSFTTLAPNTWVPKSQFPGGPLAGAVSFVVKDKLYVGTGVRFNYTSDFYEFDQAGGTWTRISSLPGSVRASAIAFSIDDYGYVGLGNNCLGAGLCTFHYFNDLWRYDPHRDSWTEMAAFPGRARATASVFVIGQTAYVTGGSTVGDNDLWQYNTATNTWTQKAPYPGKCYTRGLAFSIGNRGYVGSGWTDGACNDLWEYDPEEDSWTKRADLPGRPRHDAIGFSRGDEGFVACGEYQVLFQEEYLTDLWRYEPASDTWAQVETTYPGRGRIEMTVGVIDGRILMGLGADASAHGPEDRFADIWEYVPAR